MFVLRICVVKNVAELSRQLWELSEAVPVCDRENLHYWNGSKGKRGGLGHLEVGSSNRNDCWACGFEAAGGCSCPGRSWALTGPWEESAWVEHVPCLLVPTALLLVSQHTITTSILLSSLLAALTPLCAKPLLPACPFCPSLCHRSQGWHLDANPDSKMECSYRWEGFMYIKAAVSIPFFLSADLFHACSDITGASWADFWVSFPSWLLQGVVGFVVGSRICPALNKQFQSH